MIFFFSCRGPDPLSSFCLFCCFEEKREMLNVLTASSGCRLLCFGCCSFTWLVSFSSGVTPVKAVVIVILTESSEKKKTRKERKKKSTLLRRLSAVWFSCTYNWKQVWSNDVIRWPRQDDTVLFFPPCREGRGHMLASRGCHGLNAVRKLLLRCFFYFPLMGARSTSGFSSQRLQLNTTWNTTNLEHVAFFGGVLI